MFFNKRRVEIRKHKPKLVLAPHFGDRHIDHDRAGLLLKDVNLFTRLKKSRSGYDPHAPELYLFYLLQDFVSPTLVIDISEEYEQKLKAIKAYQSQFVKTADEYEIKPIGISDYLFHVETRSRFCGSLINTRYGEALISLSPLPIRDPLKILK